MGFWLLCAILTAENVHHALKPMSFLKLINTTKLGGDTCAMNRSVGTAQLLRLTEAGRAPVSFILDGRPANALEGDTVLTAILTQFGSLRYNEFSGLPRAGFCLMGACQDCWVCDDEGAPIRACSTFIAEGMVLSTGQGAA